METTPNDLRQQQFEIKFRGYNADDVEVFRDLAATALEEARTDVLKLTEENKHLNERLKNLVALEETLKAAVLEARRNADTTIATARAEAESIISNANREAELIIKEAEYRRNEVIAEQHNEMNKLVADINKIRFIRTNYLSNLRTLVSNQLDMIDRAMDQESDNRQKRQDDDDRHLHQVPGDKPEAKAEEEAPQAEEHHHEHEHQALDDAPPPEPEGGDEGGGEDDEDDEFKKFEQHFRED